MSELDYDLPPELIAAQPPQRREEARLLVVGSDGSFEHQHISNLPHWMREGDLLVVNDTKVLPARLLGRRADSGGRVEGLFLGVDAQSDWIVMLKSNGRLRAGQVVEMRSGQVSLELELIARDGPHWMIRPRSEEPVDELLARIGHTPLPPYILKARRERGLDEIDDADDRQRYQTVYASEPGAVAAPTAGLHLTMEMINALRDLGVDHARVTLHVGAGTFKPVEAAFLEEHPMHSEWFRVPQPALAQIRATRARGGRIIAVGTTAVRTLESLPDPLPESEVSGTTDLLIAPGYTFRFVDGMLTNFHLPRSTLLALVAARLGLSEMKAVYAEAIKHRYRFYSYGDAMLIVPR